MSARFIETGVFCHGGFCKRVTAEVFCVLSTLLPQRVRSGPALVVVGLSDPLSTCLPCRLALWSLFTPTGTSGHHTMGVLPAL